MKMPNTKYTGSYIKGNLGGTKVSNPSLKKYYGKMIDAPGFKSGGKTAAWQRKEGKSESGGLNKKGVASYRAANPGSKLKTAVTTKPSKLKEGSTPKPPTIHLPALVLFLPIINLGATPKP